MEWDAEIARDAAAGKFDALGQWVIRWGVAFNPNTEVGGTAFAAIIGSTSRRAILDSINWIQPLRSPTSCAAKHGTAYGPSNFGIRDE